jgi:hypothetical protein
MLHAPCTDNLTPPDLFPEMQMFRTGRPDAEHFASQGLTFRA